VKRLSTTAPKPSTGADAVDRDYRDALVAALGHPFFEGNRIDLLRNGVEIFPAMLEAIDEAAQSVDLLTYVYWSGDIAVRFADTLSRAATRGVRVRVLLDGVGALPMDRSLIATMESSGALVRWFRPARRWFRPWEASHRTHRKVLICDRRVGFTGGVGISEEWEGDARDPGEWRETHFRVEGPALKGLESAFLGNWLEVAPDTAPDPLGTAPRKPAGSLPVQVVRSSAAVSWSDMSTLMHTLIGLARRSIRISTPYFGPDEAIATRLMSAADNGVAIDVLVPGPYIDARVAKVAGEDIYEDLLRAGIRIWEYQPTMIHQKITVVDSQLVAIGSGNLNHRSLRQDDEVQLIVDERGFAAEVDTMLDDDWRRAVAVRPSQWKRRGVLQRTAEVLVRPFKGQV
jgi:cardiolipin synthase